MKKTAITFSLIFMFLGIFAQQNKPINIKSKIKSASIYLAGAELIRNKSVNLKKGENSLVFINLSHKINIKSIRITTQDGVDLLGISHKINYLSANKDIPALKKVKDSLKLMSKKIQNLRDETDAYQTEKKMLLANMSIGGTNSGVAVSELRQASDFYRTKITEINKKVSYNNTKINEYSVKVINLKKELNQLNTGATYPRSEITILVSSNVDKASTINLKYIVSDCGWSPSYDIKALDTDKPVELTYRAKVFNNTGINWDNLSFNLSTADPTLSAEKPNLKPWYLTYYTYRDNYSGRNMKKKEGYAQNMVVQTQSNQPQTFGNVNDGNNNNGIVTFEEVEIPELSAEFKITKKYSIPADDKPYIVEISKHNLPATYKHFAVTKLDKDVFLIARITGWEDLNLVQGPANVYYAGTYLGQSFINTRNVKDTLDLSLGRDSKVIITRSKLKNFSSTQLIGTKKKEIKTFEMIAKNNRKTPIEIQLLDQLPISQSDEIEVKALELSGAEYDINTGELKWLIKLAPGEKKKITLSYYIKYPKNKTLETKKNTSRQIRYKF